MDWRMIAALSAAGGAFCLFGAGVYAVMTAAPPPASKFASPVLLTEHRTNSPAGASFSSNPTGSSTSSNPPATANTTSVSAAKPPHVPRVANLQRSNVPRPDVASANTAVPNTVSLDDTAGDPPPASHRTHKKPH